MKYKRLIAEEKEKYSAVVAHPVQTWEWGDFREKCEQKAVRYGGYDGKQLVSGAQVLFRGVPYLGGTYGFVPKSHLPCQEELKFVREVAGDEKAVFVRFEPDVVARRWQNTKGKLTMVPDEEKVDFEPAELGLTQAPREVFSRYSFLLDLEQSEDDLLANMHSKTRYNIRLAKKKGVEVSEQSDTEGIEIFLDLNRETTERKRFYMHSDEYFRDMWEVLGPKGVMKVLVGRYEGEPLCAWILFLVGDVLYYPYGASSSKYRNLMASNLVCWEAIRLGQKLGCKVFDLWGSLGPEPDESDPWYGFHRFKLGYGPDLVEYVGSWDLVLNPMMYRLLNLADSLRWALLRLRRR